jgi:hypothetical protein
MKIEHPEIDYKREFDAGRIKTTPSLNPRVVLEELFNLLEDYGPTWYTDAHRERIFEALFSGRSSERSSRTC